MNRPEAPTCVIDPKQLARLVVELNIARKQILSYPPGHPLIRESSLKALFFLQKALESCPLVTLGVSRDSLWLGDHFLDKKHPVFRDFASALFAQEIASVSFYRGLDAKELIAFNELLALSPSRLPAQGGIEHLMAERGVRRIAVKLIDYQAFKPAQGEKLRPMDRKSQDRHSEELWDGFVQSLLADKLDPASTRSIKAGEISPEMLAELMNSQQPLDKGASDPDYSTAITGFLRSMDQDGIEQQSAERLSRLVQGLNPKLRAQFLQGTFGKLEHHPHLAKEVLAGLSTETLIQTLEEINQFASYVPPQLLGVLRSLSPSGPDPRRLIKVGGSLPEAESVEKRVKAIFETQNPDDYLPAGYQKTLEHFSRLKSSPIPRQEELRDLHDALVDADLESHLSAITLEILRQTEDPRQLPLLKEQLLDIYRYHLETGDFQALTRSCRALKSLRPDSPLCARTCKGLLAFFATPAFVEEVLCGLVFWGKAKQAQIEALISTVGKPFVEALLERLGSEDNMSLRRLYMNALIAIGPRVVPAVLERLRDERWFFVRNLVVLLRELRSPEVLPALKRLCAHAHPKVRQETLRTFLTYDGQEARQLLMRELENPDPQRRLEGVRMARGLGGEAILRKLTAMLLDSSAGDYELKGELVAALAESGQPQALPALEQLLASRSLRHPILHRKFRIEIIRSLRNYPPRAVRPLLEKYSRSGQSGISEAAGSLLESLEEQP